MPSRASKKGAVPIETPLVPSGASKTGPFLSRHFWCPPGLQKRSRSYRDTSGALQGFKKGAVPIEAPLVPSRASKKVPFLSRHLWCPPGLQKRDSPGRPGNLPKRWGVSRPPGAAQIPKIDDSRSLNISYKRRTHARTINRFRA